MTMKQRSRVEILAAIEGTALSSRARIKALVKAALDVPPFSYLSVLGGHNRAYRRRISRCLPSWIKFRGVYSSFEEARANAARGVLLGFDHDEIACAYRDYGMWPSDYPAMMWLSEALGTGASVFDFGGSVGNLFYLWEKYLKYPEDLKWLVCDLPAVARAGDRLSKEKGEMRLSFTSRFEDADGFNCLLASGSLQCMESSIGDLLRGLRFPPQHLVFNRLPLHAQFECITLQNVGWVTTAYRVFQRDRFLHDLESLGYVVVDAWSAPDQSCWIPFYPEYSLESYSGLYLRRVKAESHGKNGSQVA